MLEENIAGILKIVIQPQIYLIIMITNSLWMFMRL